MADKNRPPTDESADHEQHDGWSNRTKVIIGLVGLVVFGILYILAVTVVPRSWANFITGITQNSFTTSILLGAVLGIVFSLIPILVFMAGLRMRKTWKGVVGSFVAALVVALPNIITIGIAVNGRPDGKSSADAAWRTLDQKAPWFIGSTWVGIAIGAGIGIWIAWATTSRRRAKRKAAKLEAEKRALEESHAAPANAPADADNSHDAAPADAPPADGDPAPSADGDHDPQSADHGDGGEGGDAADAADGQDDVS